MWSEWHWTATGLNMAGAILFGVEEERIVWGRLYVEPVEKDGENIDQAVRRMTEGRERRQTEESEEASPT